MTHQFYDATFLRRNARAMADEIDARAFYEVYGDMLSAAAIHRVVRSIHRRRLEEWRRRDRHLKRRRMKLMIRFAGARA
jgi:hypothetical protein